MANQLGMRLGRATAPSRSGLPRKNLASATASGNARGTLKLQTKTFVASEPWTAPASTSHLVTAIGQGGAGAPTQTYYDVTQTVTVVYDSPAYGQNGTQTTEERVYNPVTGEVPPDRCDAPVYYPDDHATLTYCFDFGPLIVDSTSFGPSATGFGLTFIGGNGGAATPTKFEYAAITPGRKYDVAIPTDGWITITYYELISGG